MPGSDGPNPQLSSGSKVRRSTRSSRHCAARLTDDVQSLEVVEEGKFVDFSGTRRATLSNGAWELVWRKNANAGALICGFDVPVAIERNEAKIPEVTAGTSMLRSSAAWLTSFDINSCNCRDACSSRFQSGTTAR